MHPFGFELLLGLVYFWDRWGYIKIKDDHFDRERFTKNRNIIKENI
jgi:hypothetical protein